MGYTPRQISVRAQETAWALVSALDRDAIVADFLDAYCREFDRPGEQEQPAHYREMLGTIKRESLLEMVTFLEAELPRRLGILTRTKAAAAVRKKKKFTGKNKLQQMARKPPRLLAAERQKIDLFRQEFFSSLGRVLEWRKEEFGEFWRDHLIYKKLNDLEFSGAPAPTPRKLAASVAGPFVDRCALLLDPSLMEIARRAAARFRSQLHGKTALILKDVFTRRREN